VLDKNKYRLYIVAMHSRRKRMDKDLASQLFQEAIARMRYDAAIIRAKDSMRRMAEAMKDRGVEQDGDPDEERDLDIRTEARAVNGDRP